MRIEFAEEYDTRRPGDVSAAMTAVVEAICQEVLLRATVLGERCVIVKEFRLERVDYTGKSRAVFTVEFKDHTEASNGPADKTTPVLPEGNSSGGNFR